MTDLSGKIAIVTGENSGMGLSTVEALNNKGATVIIRCMNEERGRTAIAKLTKEKEGKLDFIICDLGDYASIRDFFSRVKGKYPYDSYMKCILDFPLNLLLSIEN